MGDHLELRPPCEDDLTIIEKLTQDPEVTGEFAWFGWHDQLRWRRTPAARTARVDLYRLPIDRLPI
jgi:hypothetical protein